MKIDRCYIISWFGRDPELRQRRKAMHQAQLSWCREHALHPVVFAQEYEPSDYEPDVTYIKNTGDLLHPGPARNRLLEVFYNSDDDYAVFADNDGVLYQAPQHGDSARYIEIMRGLDIENFDRIDIINPANPQRTAFVKEIADSSYQTHLVFRKSNKIKGTVFFMKNLKKHDRLPLLWFDEALFNDQGRMLPGEDTEFGVAAWMSGLGCYHTFNAIVNELGADHSTWAQQNEHADIVPIYQSINQKYQKTLFVIPDDVVKHYSYIGYSQAPNGKYVFRVAVDPVERQKVFEKYNHTNVKFYAIPPMTVDQAMQHGLANIEDPVLQSVLNELVKQKKTFINRGKKRVQFDWTQTPFTVPALSDKILVKK